MIWIETEKKSKIAKMKQMFTSTWYSMIKFCPIVMKHHVEVKICFIFAIFDFSSIVYNLLYCVRESTLHIIDNYYIILCGSFINLQNTTRGDCHFARRAGRGPIFQQRHKNRPPGEVLSRHKILYVYGSFRQTSPLNRPSWLMPQLVTTLKLVKIFQNIPSQQV